MKTISKSILRAVSGAHSLSLLETTLSSLYYDSFAILTVSSSILNGVRIAFHSCIGLSGMP